MLEQNNKWDYNNAPTNRILFDWAKRNFTFPYDWKEKMQTKNDRKKGINLKSYGYYHKKSIARVFPNGAHQLRIKPRYHIFSIDQKIPFGKNKGRKFCDVARDKPDQAKDLFRNLLIRFNRNILIRLFEILENSEL